MKRRATHVTGSVAPDYPAKPGEVGRGQVSDQIAISLAKVAILTGGGDKPYAHGLASALIAEGLAFDFIGSDDLRSNGLERNPQVKFLNLRGNQRPDVAVLK